MQLTKHRDGTVSVRMTREQLHDLASGATYGMTHWTYVVNGHHGGGLNIDKEILDDMTALNTEMEALTEAVKR